MYRAHPDGHEFGQCLYVFLSEVLPRGPVLVCKKEKRNVIAPDPEAEETVRNDGLFRTFVVAAFIDKLGNQTCERPQDKCVVGHAGKPHKDSHQDAHYQNHAELLHFRKEQHEHDSAAEGHQNRICRHEYRDKAEHGKRHDNEK